MQQVGYKESIHSLELDKLQHIVTIDIVVSEDVVAPHFSWCAAMRSAWLHSSQTQQQFTETQNTLLVQVKGPAGTESFLASNSKFTGEWIIMSNIPERVFYAIRLESFGNHKIPEGRFGHMSARDTCFNILRIQNLLLCKERGYGWIVKLEWHCPQTNEIPGNYCTWLVQPGSIQKNLFRGTLWLSLISNKKLWVNFLKIFLKDCLLARLNWNDISHTTINLWQWIHKQITT